MRTTPYIPREGSMPARLIAHLQEHGGSMGTKQIAELLGIPPNNVPPNMAAALHHGALVRDGGNYSLPLGTATQPAADLQQAWGGATKPAFPSAPPRVGGPLPTVESIGTDTDPEATTATTSRRPAVKKTAKKVTKTPRKMRTLKEVARQFHREDKQVGKTRAVVVATKEPARSSAIAHLEPVDLQPASLRQVGGTHYKQMTVQPWDVVDGWPLELRIGYYRGNALKYLMRMGSKDRELLEIEKCQHYVSKLVEVLRERDAQVAA